MCFIILLDYQYVKYVLINLCLLFFIVSQLWGKNILLYIDILGAFILF